MSMFRLFHAVKTSWGFQRTLCFKADQAGRICHVQVLGTGSSEVGPSLFVRTGYGRYLFNCPELLQFALRSNQIHARPLRHIFITKCSMDNIGGIPGFALALKLTGSAITCPPITGPPNLKMLPNIKKLFVDSEKDIAVATDRAIVLDDDDLKVIAVELTPPITSSSTQLNKSPIKHNKELLKSTSHLLNVQKSDSIFAYILQLPTIRGKFNPEKAKELGLRPGPQYKQLIKGNSVISSTGQVVHPHQVMAPDQIGQTMLVLECPSHAYIPSLISHPFLQSPKFNPALIAHTTPRHVLECNEYQNWMNSFKEAKHMLIHSDYCLPEMTSKSYDFQLPLHLIDSEIFRLPHFVCDYKSEKENSLHLNSSILIGQNSLRFHLRPLAKFGKVEFPDLKTRDVLISEALEELKENPNFMKQIENYTEVKTNFHSMLSNHRDSKIPLASSTSLTSPCRGTFLGTGSAYPTRIRGTSFILVHLPSGDYMLLDAGEGTMSQLYKCFGPSIADEILRKLKCVFISHTHSDHHLGLIGIIQKREQLLNNNRGNFTHRPLVILAPFILLNWLCDYSQYCEKIRFDFTKSKCDTPLPSILKDTGLSHMELVPVIHIPDSKAIILYCEDQTNQYKIVYSSDTRPCRELIQAGRDASLLIHEATFDHSLHESAVVHKHTTNIEALKVASKMRAQFLITTHFSQRYKMNYSGANKEIFDSLWSNGAAVAFDFMSIRLDKLEMLRELNPIISDVLPNSLVINELEEDVIDCID